MLYVEPAACVPLNNELSAVRAECYSAEEAVLWRLTGLVIDEVEELQHCLATVGAPFD